MNVVAILTSVIVFFLIPLVAVAIIWHGFVLFILWGWFAFPIFGLPPLTLPQAIATALTIALLTHQHQHLQADAKGSVFDRLVFMFMHPALVLFCAWVVSHWIAP